MLCRNGPIAPANKIAAPMLCRNCPVAPAPTAKTVIQLWLAKNIFITFAVPQKVDGGYPQMSRRQTKHGISNVSDHADVVLKKSDEKILSDDKVTLLYKRTFFFAEMSPKPGICFSASWGHSYTIKNRWGVPPDVPETNKTWYFERFRSR